MTSTLNKNLANHDSYPATTDMHRRCVNMIASLFHAPSVGGDATGTSTAGSSEAIFLAVLALKTRWMAKQEQEAASRGVVSGSGRPNLVMSYAAHIAWKKAIHHFGVEGRYIPSFPSPFVGGAGGDGGGGGVGGGVTSGSSFDPGVILSKIDANTIGVVSILGTTQTGHYEDTFALSELLLSRWRPVGSGSGSGSGAEAEPQSGNDNNNQDQNRDRVRVRDQDQATTQNEHGNQIDYSQIPIHVDAASGGFVAPFLSSPSSTSPSQSPNLPEETTLKWDFTLPNIASINTSSHKYGLVPPGLGWLVFRSASHLPPELTFRMNYLGSATQSSYTLNFSRSAGHVVLQYFNFVRLGFAGYREVMLGLVGIAGRVSLGVREMGTEIGMGMGKGRGGGGGGGGWFEVLSSEGNGRGGGLPLVAFRIRPAFMLSLLLDSCSCGDDMGSGALGSESVSSGSDSDSGSFGHLSDSFGPFGSDSGLGPPSPGCGSCFTTTTTPDGQKNTKKLTFDEFAIAKALKKRGGWMVPAYTMPPPDESVAVLRVVVRQDFSVERCDEFLADLRAVMQELIGTQTSRLLEKA